MSDASSPALAVTDLVRAETPGGIDPAVVARLPPGPVRLVPGGTFASASRAQREAMRGAVRALVASGHEVQVEADVLGAHDGAEALADALHEVAALALRCPDQVRFTLAWPASSDDPFVQAWLAVAGVDAGQHHTATLAALRACWLDLTRATDDETLRRRGEVLVRRLDDAPRRAVFAMLRQAWLQLHDGWPGGKLDKRVAMDTAVSVLGEQERWIKAFRQYTYDTVRRMVLIPTWQCELRCSYCWIPKQDGRVMSRETIERGVEMLLSTEQSEVMLQFFGGEALIEWERVQHALTYASRRADEVGKRISYVISSNGWSLTPERVQWLARHPVRLELSLDGDARTQNRYRPSRWRDEASYDHSIATWRDAILGSGIEQYVIMVVHPTNVDAMPDNFFHIADLGFRSIQINNMLGRVWKPHEVASFATGLHRIGKELQRRWAEGESLEFINMKHKPMAMRLNGEVTIDHDGTIYGGNGFLHETEHKDKFAIAHLDDLTNVDRYWIDATDNNFLLDWSYRPKVTQNNVEVGKVMTSFIRWMNKEGYGPDGPLAAGSARSDGRTQDPADLAS